MSAHRVLAGNTSRYRDAIEAMAKELADNESRFDSYVRWAERRPMAHQWAVVTTTHREADALTRSNARVIAKELAPFLRQGRDVFTSGASHWACGWTEGYEIRVYSATGQITRAFWTYALLQLAIEEYPALDEDDWSQEESDDAAACWASMRPSERIEHLRKYCDGPYDSVKDAMHVDSFSELLGAIRNGTHPPYTSSGYEGLTGY